MSTREEKEAGEKYDQQQNENELVRIQRELRDRGREHALYRDAMNKRFTRDQSVAFLFSIPPSLSFTGSVTISSMCDQVLS